MDDGSYMPGRLLRSAGVPGRRNSPFLHCAFGDILEPKAKARTCYEPGVYVHVMYDPDDDNYVGLYVGSSLCIGTRIKEHEWDLAAAKKRKSMPARLSRKFRRLGTSHIKFWSRRPGIQSFWFIFGQLERRGDSNKGEVALLLNVLEMYSMLLFRTLPVQTLWTHLPQGSRLNPFSWTGLNTANPLDQWRQEVGFSLTKKPYHFAQRFASARNVLYRDADPSLGDKLRVKVVCHRCHAPQSLRVDHLPRYEKASGKYLTRVRAYCHYCATGKAVTFIPIDRSLPTKSYDTLRHEHAIEQSRKDLSAPTTRTSLNTMTAKYLVAWLASHGFRSYKARFGRRADILPRAEAVWDYLAGPQDLEASSLVQKIFDNHQTYYPRPPRNAKPSTKASTSHSKTSPTSASPTKGAPSRASLRASPTLVSTRVPFTEAPYFQVSSQTSQSPEQKDLLHNNISLGSHLISIKTKEIKPQGLDFLKDIDLSTFPRCDYCFRKRCKCDGNRPCYSCWKSRARCKDITLVALKESPEFARYILERKEVRKPKKAEVLTIEASSFPKCNFCFLKQYKCCGNRPCHRCQVAKAICRDVANDALNEYPDRARHVLELSSQGHTPYRYCVSNGRTCYRASSTGPCKTCTRYGRPCSNNLEGVKEKGMYNVQPNTG